MFSIPSGFRLVFIGIVSTLGVVFTLYLHLVDIKRIHTRAMSQKPKPLERLHVAGLYYGSGLIAVWFALMFACFLYSLFSRAIPETHPLFR